MNSQERLRRKRAAKGKRRKARTVDYGKPMGIVLNPPSMWKRDGMRPEDLKALEDIYYEDFPDERPKAEEGPT